MSCVLSVRVSRPLSVFFRLNCCGAARRTGSHELDKLVKCPLVLSWRDTGKWKRDVVKEALPLPLVVVHRLDGIGPRQ